MAHSDPGHAERLAAETVQAPARDEGFSNSLLRRLGFKRVIRAIADSDQVRAERLARMAPDSWRLDPREVVSTSLAESDPEKAEGIARAISDDGEKVSALTSIARARASADPGGAERLTRDATRIALTMPFPYQHSAMEDIASAQAMIARAVLDRDPDQAERVTRANPDPFVRDRAGHEPRRARRIAAEAERIVRGIPGGQTESWPLVLGEIAIAAAAGDPQDAERIAGIIAGEGERADALARVALAIGCSHPGLARGHRVPVPVSG